jgi:hypothetical protein
MERWVETDSNRQTGLIFYFSQKIDNQRGDVPRSTFIRRAAESYLKAKER